MPLLKTKWLTGCPIRNRQSVIIAERRFGWPALPRAGAARDNSNSAEPGEPTLRRFGSDPIHCAIIRHLTHVSIKASHCRGSSLRSVARLSTEEGLSLV
jgi:hypothetical protein